MNKKTIKKGFTLIEVLVSVSIFSIVMLVASGAVFSIVDANKKAHSLKSVMTNLNFALESIARDTRVGSKYSCNGGGDCTVNPSTKFSYKANRDLDGNSLIDDFVEYSLVGEAIQKRVYGGSRSSIGNITASEVHIQSLKFYVIGTAAAPGDLKQPKLLLSIQGYAGASKTRSDFSIQTTISQRSIDS
jgi:prepilin-type N-terminal cleavage/methylation domain-containing protein